MACIGKRAVPKLKAKAVPTIGERGFLKLLYVGADPAEALPGQVTGVTYPFDKVNPLLVDKMDATYLLGPEFEEL